MTTRTISWMDIQEWWVHVIQLVCRQSDTYLSACTLTHTTGMGRPYQAEQWRIAGWGRPVQDNDKDDGADMTEQVAAKSTTLPKKGKLSVVLLYLSVSKRQRAIDHEQTGWCSDEHHWRRRLCDGNRRVPRHTTRCVAGSTQRTWNHDHCQILPGKRELIIASLPLKKAWSSVGAPSDLGLMRPLVYPPYWCETPPPPC